MTVGRLLFVCLYSRNKPTVRENELAGRVTKRLVHLFAQGVETGLSSPDSPLLSECPEPTKCTSYHPLLKASRMKGSTVLKERLLERFGRKSTGFMSKKEEPTLEELGILTPSSKFATRLAGDFLIRYFAKTSSSFQKHMAQNIPCRVLNFSMDAARVCREQAGLPALDMFSLSRCVSLSDFGAADEGRAEADVVRADPARYSSVKGCSDDHESLESGH